MVFYENLVGWGVHTHSVTCVMCDNNFGARSHSGWLMPFVLFVLGTASSADIITLRQNKDILQ